MLLQAAVFVSAEPGGTLASPLVACPHPTCRASAFAAGIDVGRWWRLPLLTVRDRVWVCLTGTVAGGDSSTTGRWSASPGGLVWGRASARKRPSLGWSLSKGPIATNATRAGDATAMIPADSSRRTDVHHLQLKSGGCNQWHMGCAPFRLPAVHWRGRGSHRWHVFVNGLLLPCHCLDAGLQVSDLLTQRRVNVGRLPECSRSGDRTPLPPSAHPIPGTLSRNRARNPAAACCPGIPPRCAARAPCPLPASLGAPNAGLPRHAANPMDQPAGELAFLDFLPQLAGICRLQNVIQIGQ